MKRLAACVAFLLMALSSLPVHAGDEKEGRFAVDAGVGMQGILSFEEVGIRMPLFGRGAFIGVKARLLSSLTWATFIDMRTGRAVSFHPDVIGGVLAFGGASPMLRDSLRMYGQAELLLGYSFTPWDSAIYGVGNLIGDNLTFAVRGCFGLELFTSETLSVFFEAGGGFKSLIADKTNPYVIASSWLGSGFGFEMGTRFYLGAADAGSRVRP